LKKIVSISGARPQFVKAAVLSRIIRSEGDFEERIIHTGQHYDINMSEIFFREMEIPAPDYSLHINRMNHGAMTGKMLEQIENVLVEEKPRAVVVYGDTNSTLAGALAAAKLHIPVIHVEAGLRSFNMKMPEEINRVLTDRISQLLLCPTPVAVENLKNEGFENSGSRIALTGDIMKDAVLYYGKSCEEKARVFPLLNLKNNSYILATVHRQENTDHPGRLKSVFAALDAVHEKTPVVVPLHPRTEKFLRQYGIETRIIKIKPVGYFDMLSLLKHSKMVVTDSGGLQKEAYFHRKPVVVLRDETEWVELVRHGFARITGAVKERITDAVAHFENLEMDFGKNLYGDHAGDKIYREIKQLIQ